jgi:hypothetical protein
MDDPFADPPVEPVGNRDLVFEAMCEVCGIDWRGEITKDQRGRVNAALKQLRDVYPDDLTLPMMIHERASAWKVVYPEIPPTPQALVGNWSSLLQAATQVRETQARAQKDKRKVTNAHARSDCELCGGDHHVSLGESPEGYELTAPCPQCGPSTEAAGYWVQGRRVQPLDPEEVRRRMQ